MLVTLQYTFFFLALFSDSRCDKVVGGQPPRYAPAPLLPGGHRSTLRHLADGNAEAVSRGQHCSRLTRQHGSEQSGLVTLTFDHLTLKVVSESRVTWASSVPILVFLGLCVLDLGQMYVTDRQTSDSITTLCDRFSYKQTHRSEHVACTVQPTAIWPA